MRVKGMVLKSFFEQRKVIFSFFDVSNFCCHKTSLDTVLSWSFFSNKKPLIVPGRPFNLFTEELLLYNAEETFA